MGIYIGGTGSANYFDDYEEGSWTPSMDGLSNTPQYYNLVGKYTKIGNQVKAHGFIQINGTTKPQFSNLNAIFKISGLPFTCNGEGYFGAGGQTKWAQLDWRGPDKGDYGHNQDTMLQAGITNSTKTVFNTCGPAVYYCAQSINRAFHNNYAWWIDWEFWYKTNS